jgi:hypothetical protein
VRIDDEGRFGPIETIEYVISVDDLRGSRAAPPGYHSVPLEIHEMTMAITQINESVKRLQAGHMVQQLRRAIRSSRTRA